MSALGQLIADVLREKQLSLREAAKVTGVGHSHIRNIIMGIDSKTKKAFEPSPTILRKLAAGLGVSYVRLMDLAGYLPDNVPADVLELLADPRNASIVDDLRRDPSLLEILKISSKVIRDYTEGKTP